MLLILEEYFRDHPTKMRIVEGLFDRGISVNNSKFYANGLEISVSEVAKYFKVNRRTVYETIKIIEDTPGVREIMAHMKPVPSMKEVALLTGDQVVSLHVRPGFFSGVMYSLVCKIRPYGSYVKEFYALNQNKKEILVRAILYRTVPKKLFQELSQVEGIEKIIIESPDMAEDEPVCSKCEVRVCSSKLSSSIFEEDFQEL